MELSKLLAESIEVPDIEGIADKKAIALLAGGVDLSEGGTNTFFAKNIVEKSLGPQVATVPVPNAYSNSQDFGMGGDLKKLFADFLADVTGNEELRKQGEAIPLDRLLNISTEAGFNPDAIMMDATRRAYESKYGQDKRFIFAGTSAGTIAAEEATAIAERGGATNVKGFGATLPMAGLTNTASNENFRAFVGNLDPMAMAMFGEQFIDPDQLSKAQKKIVKASKLEGMPDLTGMLAPSRNTEMVQGTGEAHHLGQFLANPDVKKRMGQFLDLDLSTEYEGKSGTAAFKQYADMFGQFDALTRTLRMLEGDASAFAEEAAGKYSFVTPDLKLRKTYGDSQEKADLEYATDEYSTGKRVKGLAREDSESFKALMADLITTIKGGADLKQVDGLINRMNKIFGETPRMDQAIYTDIQKMTRGKADFQDIVSTEGMTPVGFQPIEEKTPNRKVRKPHTQYRQETLTPTPPVADIPDVTSVLATQEDAKNTGTEIAKSFVQGVGEGLTNVAETAGTAMAESAEKGAVNLINRLMRRVPGDSEAIDVTAPLIDKLSDIGPEQIAKASALGIEDAATVLGKLAKAGASAAIALGKVSQSVGVSLKGAQPPANAFIGESRKRLGAAKDLLENVKSSMGTGALPDESIRGIKMLSGTQDAEGYISRMLADVEAAISQLPAEERTKPLLGNQLANLKSQITKIEKQLSEVVSQLDPAMLEAGSTPLALPSAERTIDVAQSPAKQVLQLKAANPPPNYKAQIKQLGLKFSDQLKTARTTDDSTESKALAQNLIASAADARKAISDLLSELGDDADDGLKNLASAARQRITKSVKGARKLVDTGENAGAGMDIGIRGSIDEVKVSAQQLAQAAIDSAEDTLDIQSPSKVFKKIGQYTVEGFKQGLGGFGETFDALYQMADLYQTNLRKAFDSSVITDEIKLVMRDVSELGNALGRIANLPNESIVSQYKRDVRSNAHLAKSPEGMGMHSAGKTIPANAQQVVFVSSGFTGTKGKISNEIAGKLGRMAPDSSHMVPFESKFDVSGTLDEVGLARVVKDAILEPMKAVKRGYNSEAMRLAKQAYSVKQQRPDADIKFVGHSAGGFVVREAQEILKSLGIVSEALSMGTPLLGAFQAIKDDAVSIMGEFDQLRPFSGQKEAVVPGVGGHFSPEYLDNSNEIRQVLTQYLDEGITPALIKKIHDLGEAIQGLEPGKSGGLMRYDRARSAGKNTLGGDVGTGFAQGLTGSMQLVTTSAAELAEEAIEAVEGVLEISSPSKVFIRIGEQISKGLAVGVAKGKSALGPSINALKEGAVDGFKGVVLGPEEQRQPPQFKPFEVNGRRPEQDIPIVGEAFSMVLDSMESMKNAATFIPKLGRALSQVFEGLMQNSGMLMGMAKGALVFNFAIKPLIGLMVNFENQSFAVAVGLDNMARMITFVSGSAREGARNIDFIREKVLALGGDINASMSGFAQIGASAQGTRLEGESTRQIFGAVSQASAVYQLDDQTQDRAFTAIAQMMDKTVVSAEELRGQLAEALPGSLAIAARAMGTTTQEMGQMMSTGQILAEDLLPKFAQQLAAETSSGVAGSADSAQSAINMLNNEVLFLQEAVGKTSIPVRVTGIKAAATGMKLLRENMELIAPVMTAVFITLMKNAVVNAIRFLAQFAPLAALFKAATAQGAKMFATLLTGMKTFAAQFARTFIIIQGVTDLLAIFQKALGDTSGGIRDLAEISTQGWEDYADSVKKAAEAQEGLNASVDKFKAPSGNKNEGTITSLTGGESLLEQTFLGSLLPKEASRFLERGVQKLPTSVFKRTFEDVKAENQTIAIGELLNSGGSNISEASRLLSGGSYATDIGTGSLKQVSDLDRQLKNLQQQRSALTPGDADARREIEKEINDLIKKRQSLYSPIGKIQRNLTQDIENYKDALKVVQEELSRADLSDSRRSTLEDQAAVLEFNIEDAQKQLDKVNATIGESVNKLTLLGRELQGIAADLAANQFFDQIEASQQNIALARSRVNGASQGEVAYTGSLLRRDQLNTQISTNQTAIRGFENTLADSEYTQALENAGLAAEATSAEIQAAIENLSDGSLKTTLETVAEFKGQLETLQLDTVNLEEQMLQSQAEANEQIRDANREITEYYREIANQAAELQMQVRETANQTEFGEIKNALKGAMTGISGSFVDDWIGGYMDFLSTMQEMIQTQIDADRQRMQLKQQQMQAQMQAQQMGRNLPGIAGGMGATGGNAVQSGLLTGPSAHIGGSAANHIDHKIPKAVGEEMAIQMFDQLSRAYAEQGRRIEFSNSAVSGEVWNPDASMDQKRELLNRVDAAHSHSPNPTYWDADYYVPRMGDARSAADNSSSAGVNMLLPQLAGARTEFGQAGRYGNFVNVYSESGELLFKMGHGDNRQQLPSNFTMGTSPTPMPQMPMGGSVSTAGLTVKGNAATQEQIGIAQRIYQVGSNLGANNQEIQAAIATAIQESVLTNLSGGDRDSLGIFQQRPSMEWGSRDQISTLDFAIESFFSGRGSNPGMIDNRGRAGGDVYQQSHLTQRSAHPDAPRQWDGEAAALLRAVSGGAGIMPTGVNMAQFNGATGLQNQNFSLEAELINQQEQSALALQQATARLQSLGLVNQAVQQQRSIADQDLELSRQQEDRTFQLLPQGDTRSTAESMIGDVRGIQDQTTQINRQLEDSAMQLESADQMLQMLADSRASVAQQVEQGALSAEDLKLAEEAINQFEAAVTDMNASNTKLQEFREGLLDFEFEKISGNLTRQIEDVKAEAIDVDPVVAATRELVREMETLESSSSEAIAAFKNSLDASGFNEEQVAQLVAQYEELNNIRLDNLQTEIDQLTESIQLTQDAAILQFKTEGLSELTRILNRSGDPVAARQAQFDNQLSQFDQQERQQLFDISQDTRLNQAQKDQASGIVRDTFSNRRENATYDFELQEREAQLGGRRAVFDTEQGLFGAKRERANMLGFQTHAMNQEEMGLALQDQQLNFESQLIQLERMRESVGLTNEQFAQMKTAIEQTNELSIDNIKTQFSDLPEIVGAIKQPMTDALSSWIQGTKSFDEAFGDMLSNILSNLISMMANKAIEGLLGSLLGGGSGGMSGGMGGGWGGMIMSLFTGGFKQGGKIGFMTGGPLRGADPIKDALKKEGPGARLIVANTSEWVLNRKHQDILKMYGVDERVLGFKQGGKVGNLPSKPAVGGMPGDGSTNVSVPITINNTGGNGDMDPNELAKKLADPVKALISTEIEKMQRPGGQLRRRQRR